VEREPVALVRLGRREYSEALAIQRALQAARRQGGRDWLLLVEHEPVFTLGRQHGVPKWRAGGATAAAGIPVVQVERGGDITYHGPGQLVAYVVMDLREAGLGAGDLVQRLEETAIRTVARWGIEAGRDPRNRGAWAGGRKIAQVGISVRGGVSMHGIALNVARDAGHFAMIEACGLPGVEVTSMETELGRPVTVAEVEESFAATFADVFGRALVEGILPEGVGRVAHSEE
jgi:lipoate-protein ligase B